MRTTFSQPKRRPTRKVWAAIIAAAIVAAIRAGLAVFVPDFDPGEFILAVQPVIEGALIAGAAYFAREWE